MLDLPDLIKNPNINNGQLIFYPNGYGASIVDMNRIDNVFCILVDKMRGVAHDGYELAVIKGTEDSWDLCYNTPITNDVIPNLDSDEIASILEKIKELPEV